MKKRLYRILMAVLWICFLAAAVRILFILDPGMGRKPNGQSAAAETEFPGGELDGPTEEKGHSGGEDKSHAQETGGEEALAEEQESLAEETGSTGQEADPKQAAGSWKTVIEGTASPSDAAKRPPCIAIASDLHYQSAQTTDYGKAFEKFVKEGDGKVNAYLPQLLDALIDELIAQKPDAFLLTGDITINGEKINHLELAEKLERLNQAGIQTLIIPGNHDINNYRGRLYFGDEETEAESISLEEFTQIYADFGWNQAISRDAASFSYVYPLSETVWLMLLDTAQYEPLNIVDGAVRQETLLWMRKNLERAREAGIQMIVSGHHNLLQESRMFTTMCVLENSREVVELLEEYQVPLYVSGHLHLQRIQKHKREPGAEGYGICEIVSDAVSIPPCQYGLLSWDTNGALTYETRQTDVSGWARRSGQTDENLLDFEAYEKRYVRELIRDQILEQTVRVPEAMAGTMADLYAEIYADYCAGIPIHRQAAERSEGYQSWARYLPDSNSFQEIKAMLKDSLQDNNSFILLGEEWD
ncbi:MAG: metallophosphoesterase [Lachnospiraceae bacterium]|nr:metallophosphoesterase [Lachnospiraceae bacterium]